MSISVIIPVFNRTEVLLSRSLPSVLAQTRLPQEIIIVDDGSTDGLAQNATDLSQEKVVDGRPDLPKTCLRRHLAASLGPGAEDPLQASANRISLPVNQCHSRPDLEMEERFAKTADPAGTHTRFEFGGTTILLITQENQGVSAARNTGIRAATSEWIAFLDSDDEWHKEKLERQVAHLQDPVTNPLQAKLSHTAENWLRRGVPVKQPKHLIRTGSWIFEQCVKHCCIGPSTALIHRDLFSQFDLFDTSLPVCEDYDLWLRITAKKPVVYLNEPLTTKHGGHADQLSSSVSIIDQYRVQALINLYHDKNIPASQREIAFAEAIQKLERIISGARKHGNKIAEAKFSAIHDSLTNEARM